MDESQHTIHVSPPRVAVSLAVVVAVLAFLGLTTQALALRFGHTNVFGLVPEFHLDSENNVPTYFASFLLLLAASLLAVISSFKHRVEDGFRWHWTALSAVFFLMSVDEAASFHERLMPPMRALLDADGWLYFTWVVPGAVFVLLFGLSYLKFLLHLRKPIGTLVGAAGLAYVTAALGLEVVGASRADGVGQDNLTYALIAGAEETLEMAAIVLFIYALLTYMARNVGEFGFRIGGRR